MTPIGQADLKAIVYEGIYKIRHNESGATYTFGPWVPTPLTLCEGTKLRLHNRFHNLKPGLSGILEINTSENIRPRIKRFTLSDALEYSFMFDQRFSIVIYLSTLFTLWFISVPAPLVLKPEMLSSNSLGSRCNTRTFFLFSQSDSRESQTEIVSSVKAF